MWRAKARRLVSVSFREAPIAYNRLLFAYAISTNPLLRFDIGANIHFIQLLMACVSAWHRVCEPKPRGSYAQRLKPFGENPMTFCKPSRRHVLQGAAALTMAGVLPARVAFAKDIVVGFIYVGSRDDYGYNQAHAVGAT